MGPVAPLLRALLLISQQQNFHLLNIPLSPHLLMTCTNVSTCIIVVDINIITLFSIPTHFQHIHNRHVTVDWQQQILYLFLCLILFLCTINFIRSLVYTMQACWDTNCCCFATVSYSFSHSVSLPSPMIVLPDHLSLIRCHQSCFASHSANIISSVLTNNLIPCAQIASVLTFCYRHHHPHQFHSGPVSTIFFRLHAHHYSSPIRATLTYILFRLCSYTFVPIPRPLCPITGPASTPFFRLRDQNNSQSLPSISHM
mgnify:CR=1 FL=1